MPRSSAPTARRRPSSSREACARRETPRKRGPSCPPASPGTPSRRRSRSRGDGSRWIGEQFKAARDAFDAALRQAPGSIDAQSGLVATHLAAADLTRARAQVEEWRRAAPGNRTLDVLAARVELTAGNPADAERILQSVVAADAMQLDAYELLARLYVSQGKLDRAIEQYETIAQRTPRPTGPRTMAAILHEKRGDRPKAKQVYEAIVAGDARAGIASNNLAWIYADEGRLDDALRLARIAQEQLKRRPEGDDTLGWVQLRRGVTADAIASFTRAVGRSPNNPCITITSVLPT